MTQRTGKTTVFKIDVSAVLTELPDVISLSHDGAATETYDARTLNGAAAVGMKPNGYVVGGTYTATFFYDAADATHQVITDTLTTPATLDMSATPTGGTEVTFTAGGIEFGYSAEPDGAITGTLTATVDGISSYQT